MHIPVWSIFHISSSWVCFRFNLLQFFFEQTPIVRTIFRTKFDVPCTRSHSVRISPIKRVFRSSKNFSSGRRADTVCSLPSSRGNFFLLQFNQNIWGSKTLNIQTTRTRVPAYFQSFTLKCWPFCFLLRWRGHAAAAGTSSFVLRRKAVTWTRWKFNMIPCWNYQHFT